MGYECFIFAWDVIPNGGVGDLKSCCDTKEEALAQAETYEMEYEHVEIMDRYGERVG